MNPNLMKNLVCLKNSPVLICSSSVYIVLSVHNFGPHFLEDTVKEKVFLEKLTILSLALPRKFFLRQKRTPCLQNKEWKLKKVCIRPFPKKKTPCLQNKKWKLKKVCIRPFLKVS